LLRNYVGVNQRFVLVTLLHGLCVLLAWLHHKADEGVLILLLIALLLVVDRDVFAKLVELTLTVLIFICCAIFLRALTL
jgi:hypothetical protein